MSPIDGFTCDEVWRRLNDYLDRELSADERIMVEEHLTICTGCAGEYRFEAAVLLEIRQKLRRIDIPQSVIDRVTSALDRARGEQRS